MPQEFSHESTPEFRDIEIEELREVLDELHRELQPDLTTERTRVTLEEIAEATEMPLTSVEEAVRRVREARMAAVLRELEEPLYRVERPGLPPADPFMTQRFSRETFSSLLDQHDQKGQPQTKTRTKQKKTVHENVTDHLATLVAVLVVIAVILFLILTILRVR